MEQAEIDERVKMFVDMEDPDLTVDLRELHSGRQSKFDTFWTECEVLARKHWTSCG